MKIQVGDFVVIEGQSYFVEAVYDDGFILASDQYGMSCEFSVEAVDAICPMTSEVV